MSKNELSQSMNQETKELLNQLLVSGALVNYIEEKKDSSLEQLFTYDAKGNIKQSNENCQLVLKHDELLKDAIRFNELTGKMDIVKEMPWKRFNPTFSDNDLDNIITYLEKNYGLKVDRQIERAIRIVAKENSYHPISFFLN